MKIFDNSTRYLTEAGILQSQRGRDLGIMPECVLVIPPRIILTKYLDNYISLGGKKNPNFVLDGVFHSDPDSSTEAIIILLGKMQQLKIDVIDPCFSKETPPLKNEELIARAINFRSDQVILFRRVSSLLNELITNKVYENNIITHGDFRPHHIYLDKMLKNPMLIDWEYSARGNINIDIATLIFTIQLSDINASNGLATKVLTNISKSINIDLNLIKYHSIYLALSWVTQKHLSEKSLEFLNLVVSKKSSHSNLWFYI